MKRPPIHGSSKIVVKKRTPYIITAIEVAILSQRKLEKDI